MLEEFHTMADVMHKLATQDAQRTAENDDRKGLQVNMDYRPLTFVRVSCRSGNHDYWAYTSDGRYTIRVHLQPRRFAPTRSSSTKGRDGQLGLHLLGNQRIIHDAPSVDVVGTLDLFVLEDKRVTYKGSRTVPHTTSRTPGRKMATPRTVLRIPESEAPASSRTEPTLRSTSGREQTTATSALAESCTTSSTCSTALGERFAYRRGREAAATSNSTTGYPRCREDYIGKDRMRPSAH